MEERGRGRIEADQLSTNFHFSSMASTTQAISGLEVGKDYIVIGCNPKMWPTFLFSNWMDFVNLVLNLKIGREIDPIWYFRGQADANWDLAPSLYRIMRESTLNRKKANGIEFGAFRRFRASAHLFQIDDPIQTTDWNPIPWWMLMQHYSCPTRLLDWTESPFVALYFAVEKHLNRDGIVWILPSSRLDTLMTNRFGKMHDLSEESSFLDEPIRAVYPILGTKHTERSLAQQGVYTVGTDPLSDHGSIIEEVFTEAGKTSELVRVVVPAKLKVDCLSMLRTMNICASSLFPGADGVGRSSAEYIRLRVWRTLEENS